MGFASSNKVFGTRIPIDIRRGIEDKRAGE
jgi:hypothetical protein